MHIECAIFTGWNIFRMITNRVNMKSVQSLIGPIHDDRLKTKFLKPWKGVLGIHFRGFFLEHFLNITLVIFYISMARHLSLITMAHFSGFHWTDTMVTIKCILDIMRALVSLLYMFYRYLMTFEWKTPEIINVGLMFSLSVYACMYVCLPTCL